MSFPEIKGITWMSEDSPDIISVPVTLEDTKMAKLGIEGLDVPEIEVQQYIDISQLVGLRDWYAKETYKPAEGQCLIDVNGMIDFIANVSKKDMLAAWLFYKHFKYSRR